MRFAVVALALLLTGCSEQWEGFVYPDKGNQIARHWRIPVP